MLTPMNMPLVKFKIVLFCPDKKVIMGGIYFAPPCLLVLGPRGRKVYCRDSAPGRDISAPTLLRIESVPNEKNPAHASELNPTLSL